MYYPPDSSPAPACLRPPLLVSSGWFSSPPLLLSRPPSGRFFSTSSSASPSASPAPSSRPSQRPIPRPAPRSPPTPCPVRPRSPWYLSAVLGRLGSRNSPAQPRTTPWSSRPCSRRDARLGALAPQGHVVDAHIAARAFPGAAHGVLANPDGEPVTHARTNTAIPVARLLAGLRGADGCEGAVNGRYNGSLRTLYDGEETLLAGRGTGRPRWDQGRSKRRR